MVKRKKIAGIAASALILVIALSMALSFGLFRKADSDVATHPFAEILGGNINTNKEQFYDNSVIYKLPDNVKDTDDISLIISTKSKDLLDAYDNSGSSLSFKEYSLTSEADKVREESSKENSEILGIIKSCDVDYTLGATYDTVLTGFEITIKAGDFEKVAKAIGDRATTIVGEVYEAAKTELVENNVDVYETGIFDSSKFPYDGTGMVVAVLDTGLDYTHSAFSVNNFTADRNKLGLTIDRVDELINGTTASSMYAGSTQSTLTASAVYKNEKVPFMYDYADNDPDVFPLENSHGTHVAGIIAGKDDTITGVAPNAQLVIMKTFSDVNATARTPWILSALEDCVTLGVDVINMSLGTSCGFSREMDREAVSGVYERIKERGISLIVAASNAYSSAYGSEKNGNLPLTSNPDSGTVGSPGTYAAAMSVASINGAKTSYLLYDNNIIYFTEATDRVYEEKNFFDDIFDDGETSLEIEYITIPGAGREADYAGIDVKGKIALVKRGSSSFEEKANVAQKMGAKGIIIYNNVSGEIRMNVGEATLAVCSIRQDAGEVLAANPSGIIKISRDQQSGPFMSDFSSWGPNPDLQIKPEITAHGGAIYSAVPGNSYEKMSGTSMAAPNMSGVYALLRQYVVEKFPEIANDSVKINETVNRLVMSTADIVTNTNGLPYSVRKQGAGLANLTNSALTDAYIITYDRKDGNAMDKTKIELGDDPSKTGVYTLKFSVYNFGANSLTYDIAATVMTEGVSDTKTSHGETTVTEEGYILNGANVEIVSVSNATGNGTNITVGAGQTADVTVKITLSDADKEYLNSSFKNGMYVEGFVTLTALEGTMVDLSVPYLAFYGDWTVAPIFDLDYFETNKDEIDNSIDMLDKTLPDAYATRPIGQVQLDYVSYLGSYYFIQDPSAKQIAADRKYVSLSNQDGTIHNLKYVWAGLLRNAAKVDITITEDSTGEVVFEKTVNDIRKSYGEGGTPYPANIEIDFDAYEHNLKNNTKYTVTMKGYLDYENDGADTNASNTFTFPITVDFEAPALTDVEFYTEYDKSAKKTRLYAKLAVYDNHYAMAANFGYVATVTTEEGTMYDFRSLEKYLTPIYSNENSLTYVTYELTDHISEIMEKSAKKNSFVAVMYDYALNEVMYEINLPDEFTDLVMEGFDYYENGLGVYEISPNQVLELNPKGYPESAWTSLLEYITMNTDSVNIVNNKAVGVKGGTMSRIKIKNSATGVETQFIIKVLNEGDEGYVKYDMPVVDTFEVTGYYIDKAYYILNGSDRDLGEQPDSEAERKEIKFANKDNLSLAMYPSEAVTLAVTSDFYFPSEYKLKFESSNENIVKIDENGKITAVAEGYASVSVMIVNKKTGASTYYSKSISITIKDPYVTSGPSLTNYYGNGGKVVIPSSLNITDIGAYAFTNFEYVAKTDDDEISIDDPELTKRSYLGNATIEEIVIPEGVKTINMYAFAGLTNLKKVVLPSTLEKIDYSAFLNCTSLETIEGIEHVKFINQSAFQSCNIKGTLELGRAVAIANNAFAYNNNLKQLVLPESTQSIAAYAFANCQKLEKVTIKADKIQLGQYVFIGCTSLNDVYVNASVIPMGAFEGCSALSKLTIGKDVDVISEFAFAYTALNDVSVEEGNNTFKMSADKTYITNKEGNKLMFVLPTVSGSFTAPETITEIGTGAFVANKNLKSVSLKGVTKVGDFAFADCTLLENVELGKLTEIGKYAFNSTAIKTLPDLSSVSYIGDYSYAGSVVENVVIPDGMEIGEGAFRDCKKLESITIGNNVIIGADAFRVDLTQGNYEIEEEGERDEYGMLVYSLKLKSSIKSLTIGDNAIIGSNAFRGAAKLTTITLGKGAIIGEEAFYANASLVSMPGLEYATSIGKGAFSGYATYKYADINYTEYYIKDNAYVFTYHTPKFEHVVLSSATSIGEDAFAYCQDLKTVSLGYRITEIPDRAFNYCHALTNINLAGIKTVGQNAFNETNLKNIDLSSVVTIAKYAFVNNHNLKNVTLNPEGCVIEEGAFSYCETLDNVKNLDKVTSVGDYAFAYTAIVSADLSGAEYIGEFSFMKEVMTDFELKISDKLKDIGDNPFVFCNIKPFSTVMADEFNNIKYEYDEYTYDINDTIKVIDGSLYKVVPTGYVLIIHTVGDRGTDNSNNVNVADGTVRIGAYAFAGQDVASVVLPHSLRAVGHKAFYDCQKLNIVAFTSYEAPILEEEYDVNIYYSGDHIAGMGTYDLMYSSGDEVSKEGLAIVPFYIWNAGTKPNNIYYGANFVEYIGLIEKSVIMSKPTNGQHYDSMIYSMYFDTTIEGAAAMDDVTYAAKLAIEKIPANLTLADKPLVEAARAAYDKIATEAQKALISDLRIKLEEAEQRIADLEYLANSESTGSEETPSEEETTTEGEENKGCGSYIAVSSIALMLVFICAVAFIIVKRKKSTVC